MTFKLKHYKNEFGGQTFCLRGSDMLDDLPASMRSLILPHVEEAFADPRSVFERLATRTCLPSLASYLQKVVSNNDWQLVVEDAFIHKRVTRVGFYWYHPKCFPTTIVLGLAASENKAFADMFNSIEEVSWDRIGYAGRILPTRSFIPLAEYGIEQCVFPSEANPTIFGTDSNGDVFVLSSDGRAGMVSHETGDVVEYSG